MSCFSYPNSVNVKSVKYEDRPIHLFEDRDWIYSISERVESFLPAENWQVFHRIQKKWRMTWFFLLLRAFWKIVILSLEDDWLNLVQKGINLRLEKMENNYSPRGLSRKNQGRGLPVYVQHTQNQQLLKISVQYFSIQKFFFKSNKILNSQKLYPDLYDVLIILFFQRK
jgi:hypothetical protein